LNDMTRGQQLEWARKVLLALSHECNIENNTFILLAGSYYCRDIQNHLPYCVLPLAGMRMGERMAFLKSQLHPGATAPQPDFVQRQQNRAVNIGATSLCVRLHELLQNMPRYTWEQIGTLPFDNGIYIVYETGEFYHGMDRIVRVGTHTSQNRLRRRLTDHFVRENHDGSIFRKNIGKAVLNAHNDPYLSIWALDTSRPENRRYLDPIKNADTERRVSEYMRSHLTFTAFPVPEKEQRLRLEEAIISTLNRTSDFGPGDKWPGKYSPETEIHTSGLWLKQGLDAKGLTEAEFALLQKNMQRHSADGGREFIRLRAERPIAAWKIRTALPLPLLAVERYCHAFLHGTGENSWICAVQKRQHLYYVVESRRLTYALPGLGSGGI
ncbi:MAG: hypothetical protein GXY05_15175, partial [Clostridiales bacterium]|nr:hypothetical protein [Clostridiales bacterium]